MNLVTGRNGAGKTTLLEALRLFASRGAWETLWQILRERREFQDGTDPWLVGRNYLVGNTGTPHCEPGHAVLDGASAGKSGLLLGWAEERPSGGLTLVLERGESPTAMQAFWSMDDSTVVQTVAPLAASVRGAGAPPQARMALQSIPIEGLSDDALSKLWPVVEFTDGEERVVRGLRCLRPDIERISFQSRGSANTRVPVAKLKGRDGAVPIASLGEGMARAFALLLGVHAARGGLLLVDEVDTALHFRVQQALWRVLIDAAVGADAQIVATTHSDDGVRALAGAVRARGEDPPLAQVIRLEERGGARRTHLFDEATAFDMVLADELEVR